MANATPAQAYPRADLLVEPEWLAQHLDDPDIRISDCDPQEVATARAHIPGTTTLPIHPYLRDINTNVGVLPPEQAQQIFRELGISNASRVICYDSQGGVLAARAWWVLWYYGHEHAAVLNGGWNAWTDAGLPVTTAWTSPDAGDFTPRVHEDRITSCDLMLPHLGKDDFVPLDVRSDLEWQGTPLTQNNQNEGYIPGAVHIEWREFVDWDNAARLKPATEIAQLLESHGVTRDKRVAPY
jgi:thiosulfate/3-mercaptopyruvate sulfurtransferase